MIINRGRIILALSFLCFFSLLFFYGTPDNPEQKKEERQTINTTTNNRNNVDTVSPPKTQKQIKEETAAEKIFGTDINIFSITLSSIIYSQDIQNSEVISEQAIIDLSVDGNLSLELSKHNGRDIIFAKIKDPSIGLTNEENLTVELEELRRMEKALSQSFAFSMSSSGKINEIYLSKNEIDFTSGVKRTIASRLQFIINSNKNTVWQSEESNESGIYLAEYKQTSSAKSEKTILKYKKLAHTRGSAATHKITDQKGHIQYDFKANGTFDHIKSTAAITTEMSGMFMRLDSSFNLNWKEKSNQSIAFLLSSDYSKLALHIISAFNTETLDDDHNGLKITTEEFLAKIDSLDPNLDRDELWDIREKYIESLKNNPDLLSGIAALFDGTLSDDKSSFLLGALTDTNTAEAQQALIQIAQNTNLPVATRQHVLAHIALLKSPTAQTVSYLSEVTANTALPSEIRSSAILALGGTVRAGLLNNGNSGGTQSQVFNNAVTQLEQGFTTANNPQERQAYLLGLGNAGQESSVNILLDLASSAEASDRAMAADSLRFHEGAAVDSAVTHLITSDVDPSVQIDAIRSTVYRGDNPSINESLLSVAQQSDNADVRIAALSSLDFRAGDSDAVRNEIVLASQADASEAVRDFAQDIVDARTQADAPLDENQPQTTDETAIPPEGIHDNPVDLDAPNIESATPV